VGFARRAHEIGEIRFRAGVSTQLELSVARLQLEIAEANRVQAARDLQVARIRIALLPSLPILTTSPLPEAQTVTPASDGLTTPVEFPAASGQTAGRP
jgi:outer membrane protein TolC